MIKVRCNGKVKKFASTKSGKLAARAYATKHKTKVMYGA